MEKLMTRWTTMIGIIPPLRSGRLVAAWAIPALLIGWLGFSSIASPKDIDPAVANSQVERIKVIKKVHPAIVAVTKPGGEGSGSGVLISPEGYALTNFHVIASTGPLPQAGLADGKLYDAVLVGLDKVGDVALIKLLPKVKDKPFPFVEFGDSDQVRIGDWSLAMGNPFNEAMDFTPTVTYGVISGTNRYQPPAGAGILEYTDCIQIETSINPGNSGGPLFNMRGELIGINGRGSFEKRGRVNSGVGYAISINQIKNFLGHLRAGIDADHATLGASVGTQSEDAPLAQMVIKQVLDDSDAARRGLREGDQLLRFAGRPITSTNQYKNILGIFPKDWRLPVAIRRNNQQQEMLVRLMGNMPTERETSPMGGGPRPKGGAPAPVPAPKGGSSEASKLLEMKKGYANWHFNVIERDKLLAAAKRHGDFSTVSGGWVAEGNYEMGADRKGTMRFEVSEGKDDAEPLVKLKLNIEQKLAPLIDKDLTLQAEPIGSGGLMMALYHYHRLLTMGEKGFEAGFAHGGNEPFYPFPVDGAAPKSLASLRVDCAVLRTKHGSVDCKWYYSLKDSRLLGFETYLNKDADPCEVYFSDYKAVDGKELPHRIEVRYGDKRYAVLTVSKYTLAKTPQK
jgi:S1-C subfamily serine protease